MKTVIFRKPPSVQELRKKSGEDDMSGTAAKPFTVMQVTGPVGRVFAMAVELHRQQQQQTGGATGPEPLQCPYGLCNSSSKTGMMLAERAFAAVLPGSLQCSG